MASRLLLSLAVCLPAIAAPSPASKPNPPKPPPPCCSSDTAVVRKEYGSLTSKEKLSYISAVKCVLNKPSVLHQKIPATTNKYDDYAAVHINMTTSIHIDGVFLSWHRHFVYLMEQEFHACGFPKNLGIPYWNWPLYKTLETSPMFDGSPTSLGGNGLYDPSTPPARTPSGTVLPHGTGGGCVTTGPFGKHIINFQPLDFNFVQTGLPANWTQPSPRCMTRDLNSYVINNFNNQNEINFLLARQTIDEFQTIINGHGDGPGVHGGGHIGIGGTGEEFFGSPQDPAFFLHHSMIDKVWTDWQNADPKKRRYAYAGTSTIFNAPTTPNVTDSTVLDFDKLGRTTVREVADPMGGQYCYKYV